MHNITTLSQCIPNLKELKDSLKGLLVTVNNLDCCNSYDDDAGWDDSGI